MDVVITYVNGLDPLWLQDYSRTAGENILTKRYSNIISLFENCYIKK